MNLTRLKELSGWQKASMVCLTLGAISFGVEAIETATHLNSFKDWIVLAAQLFVTGVMVWFLPVVLGIFEDVKHSQEMYEQAARLSARMRQETDGFSNTYIKIWREFEGDWLAILDMDLFALYFQAKYTQGDLYDFNGVRVFVRPAEVRASQLPELDRDKCPVSKVAHDWKTYGHAKERCAECETVRFKS